ncbi:MAG: hypothetical protein H6612_14320 [Ignavibacteriales bacterium]|nr:hypothetical protein [Ignavibacteriales bacterium]MCB9260517.1 hypothetical protein [Ignavibacteriales bacterium]
MPQTREEFIKEIVEKVLSRLLHSNSSIVKKNDEIWNTNKKLITGEDVNFAISKNIIAINALPNAIITPLAFDIIKEKNILITKGAVEESCCYKELKVFSETGMTAVLSNDFDLAYKNKTIEILQNKNYQVEGLTPKNFTFFELQNSLNRMVNELNKGKYIFGVVISKDSYQLKNDLKISANLDSNICWDIQADKACSIKSNILFINSSLIGFKKLEEKINLWINYNKS